MDEGIVKVGASTAKLMFWLVETSQVERHKANIDGQRVYLIDTPGFDDTNLNGGRSDSDVLSELADWLNRSYQTGVKLAGIIYLHRITDARMQGTALKNLQMFKRLCGDKGLPGVVLATTMWDVEEVNRRSNYEAREQELKAEEAFWGIMLRKGSKVLRQDKGETSALRILRHILYAHSQRPTAINLQIQEEMAAGKSLSQTSAGQELLGQIAVLQANYEREMAQLRHELKMIGSKDRASRQELQQLKANLELQGREINQQRKEAERMNVNNEQLRRQRDEQMRQRQEDLQRMLRQQVASQQQAVQNMLTRDRLERQLQTSKKKNEAQARKILRAKEAMTCFPM
ncbi:hypothetical protein TruAng_011438 [Truncatella angustata]|nr:hypothetical protein TruAng_011438 [Truncatella angustata]